MPASLSIRNVPDHVVEALRHRAERNRRSLQGELLLIVEQAALDRTRLTPDEVFAIARGIHAPRTTESTAMIRADRDSDHGR